MSGFEVVERRPGLAAVGACGRVAAAVACWLLAGALQAGTNIVFNGGFDLAGDPLAGWTRTYDRAGESWYAQNHQYVSVMADGSRPHVLRLNVANRSIADNQGVKVDSRAIPVDPRKTYRFSVYARSTGPMARIMLEGYRWHPRAKPGPSPQREDLRLAYRYPMIYFSKGDAGGMAPVPGQWTRESLEIKGLDHPSSKGISDLNRQNLEKVLFVVVHMVGIGSVGDLFIDDVRLESVP